MSKIVPPPLQLPSRSVTSFSIFSRPRSALQLDRSLRRAMQSLDCDRSFDRRVRIVINEFEIFEFEVADVFDRRIQFHSRQRTILTGQLFARLVEMVLVKMKIAESVNEIARDKIDNVCHHHRQERICLNIAPHTEK